MELVPWPNVNIDGAGLLDGLILALRIRDVARRPEHFPDLVGEEFVEG